MRRVLIVLLVWICSACVLTTVHGRTLPWLKESSQKRQQIDVGSKSQLKKEMKKKGGQQCQLDPRNCHGRVMNLAQLKGEHASRSRQRDRDDKRRWVDLLNQKKRDLQHQIGQDRMD